MPRAPFRLSDVPLRILASEALESSRGPNGRLLRCRIRIRPNDVALHLGRRFRHRERYKRTQSRPFFVHAHNQSVSSLPERKISSGFARACSAAPSTVAQVEPTAASVFDVLNARQTKPPKTHSSARSAEGCSPSGLRPCTEPLSWPFPRTTPHFGVMRLYCFQHLERQRTPADHYN